MKKFTLLSALLVTMAMITVSCKKDKDDNNNKSKTELLTTGNWKVAAYTSDPGQDVDGDGDVETNLFEYLEACDRDNYSTFAANGTGTTNLGTKCDVSEPDVEPFIWAFTANETKLLIDGEEATIIELSGTTLKISMIYEDAGVNYLETFTFVH